MYGDRPIRWHDKLQGYERLPDYHQLLTRIRFCDNAGSLRLDVKEGLNAAPEGCSLGTSLRTFQKLQLYSLDIGLQLMGNWQTKGTRPRYWLCLG